MPVQKNPSGQLCSVGKIVLISTSIVHYTSSEEAGASPHGKIHGTCVDKILLEKIELLTRGSGKQGGVHDILVETMRDLRRPEKLNLIRLLDV